MLNLKSAAVVMSVAVCATLSATDASAQRRGTGRPAGGGAMGRAASRVAVPPRTVAPINRGFYPRVANRGFYPRVANRGFYPRVANRGFYPGGVYPYLYRGYRPYSYPYRSGLSVGVGLGSRYRYGYYGYPYYGYPYYPYDYPYNYTYFQNYGYGYPYGPTYAPYRYAVPGYVTAVPRYSYGGVRIEGAPHDAQVFVDGHYVGIVNDFDGAFQHVNLPTGPHRVEIRAPGLAPVTFSVNVTPGQTITYHAGIR